MLIKPSPITEHFPAFLTLKWSIPVGGFHVDTQLIHAFKLFGALFAFVSMDTFEVSFTINFPQKSGVALETFEYLNFVNT